MLTKTLARLRTRPHCRTYGCPRVLQLHALTRHQLFGNILMQMDGGNSAAQVVGSGSSSCLGIAGRQSTVLQKVRPARDPCRVLANL